MIEQLDILAFGAHPDDVELSASGTIMSMIDQGYSVGIVDLTQGELGSRGTVETRYAEAAAANEIMGVKVRHNLKMQDGFFRNTPENQLKVIEMIRRYRPKIVLANAIEDRHPDHGRGSQLVSEACFYSGLKMIESTFEGEKQVHHRPEAVYHYIQDRFLEPDFVVDVSQYVDRKMDAIMAYSTQFYNPEAKEPNTPISSKEFIDFLKGRMWQFGRSMNVQAAEGFTVERTPGVKNLMDLS